MTAHVSLLASDRPDPSTRHTPAVGTPQAVNFSITTCKPAKRVPCPLTWNPTSFNTISACCCHSS